MHKFRRVSLLAVATVATLLALSAFLVSAPTSRNAVPSASLSTSSWNVGAASNFHAPVSAAALAALTFQKVGPEKPSFAFQSPPAPLVSGPSSIPINAVRFINDTSYMPQSETTVALDPSNTNHVVGGVNDARFFFCGVVPFAPPLTSTDCPGPAYPSISTFTVSIDGGHSVLKGSALSSLREPVKQANGSMVPEILWSWGDPSLAAGLNGRFFYASLAISTSSAANGIELAVSNGGLFNPATNCTTTGAAPTVNNCWTTTLVFGNLTYNAGSFEDKELISVDRDATSPFFGDVYVAWDHFNPPSNGTVNSYLARCTPALVCTMLSGGGQPILSNPNAFPAFTTPSVGSDGAVHLSWCNFGTFTSLGPIGCYSRSSAPNGGAFGALHLVTSFMGVGTQFPSYTGLVGYATEQFRTVNIPVIAADTSGLTNNLYFVVPACTSSVTYFDFAPAVGPGNCGASGVLFSKSIDGGATWSAATLVSGAGENIQPWVTVDPTNGNVVVTYYTTRFDPFNHRIDVVTSVSSDHGTTWSDVRVTNVSNEPDSDPAYYAYGGAGFGGSFIVPQYGDYLQSIAYGGLVTTLFTGDYAVEVGTFQADPWLAVSPEQAPLSVAAAGTPNPSDVNLGVAFHATPTNAAGTTTFAWTFGDGASGTGASVTHAYASTGTFTATVTATDSLGRIATDKVTVAVSTAFAAQATAAPSVTDVGVPISFSATGAGGTVPYTYSWTFGDSTQASTSTPSHSYAAAGPYTVHWTATDSAGNSVTGTIAVAVNAAPTVTLSSVAPTDVGLALALTATGSAGTTPYGFSWDWNDGSASTTTTGSGSHAFAAPGSYALKVTLTDAAGGTSLATATVTVNALPVVSVTASNTAPVTGDAVAFTSTVTGGSGPLTYAWDFGDGLTSAIASPSHSFASAGAFKVKLVVTDAVGATTQMILTITAVPPSVTTTSAIIYSSLAFFVGLVIAALVLIGLARRKKKEPQAPPPEAPPPSSGP